MNGNQGGASPLSQIAWLIRELGVTTVVILVFLGMFIGWVKSPLTETQTELDSHIKATDDYQRAQLELLEELVNAQLATCVIKAANADEKQACFAVYSVKDNPGH